jgi:hypothetical protein
VTLSDTREPATTLRTSDNASDPAVSWKVKCLNCGAALAGPFCAECGQRVLPPHPTVRELVGDAIAEFSGWDGKLANTLRLLLRRPGELTRQWLEGRRALFISPLRLYLTTSVVYFLITAAAPIPPTTGSDKIDLGGLKAGISGSMKNEQVSAAASTAIATRTALTGAARDSAIAGLAGAPKFLQPVFRRAIDEPAAFANALRAAMPRALFVLVPVFAGILGLFYRRRNYPEHLYFAIHLHAFFFIARAIGNLALYARVLPFSIAAQGAIAIWIVAYSYLALRRVYGGSPIATVLKGLGICALYTLVASSVILAMALIVAS